MNPSINMTRAPMPGRENAEVVRLILNRPERANSLTQELLETLVDRLDRIAAQPPAALVLAGAGRHFSTGGDVARFCAEVEAGNGPAYAAETLSALNTAILRLVALPCPVLAEVQGALTGGALGLVLAADLVAMDRASFIQPWYAEVGFAPDGGWTAMLPERIGTGRALEVQMLNRAIRADEAVALGLATGIADAQGVTGMTTTWLERLGSHRAGALSTTRALIWPAERRAKLAEALEAERTAFVARIAGNESRAGMKAFLGKLEKAK